MSDRKDGRPMPDESRSAIGAQPRQSGRIGANGPAAKAAASIRERIARKREEVGNAVCPDCGTELTPIMQRRTRRIALWCWKCERYLRMGEDREARRRALEKGAE